MTKLCVNGLAHVNTHILPDCEMLVFGSVAASNDGIIVQGNYNKAFLKQASLLRTHSLEPSEVLSVTFQLQLHFNNFLIKHT